MKYVSHEYQAQLQEVATKLVTPERFAKASTLAFSRVAKLQLVPEAPVLHLVPPENTAA